MATRKLSDLLSKPSFEPTSEQQQIVTRGKTGKDQVVLAYAGSGKTSTATALAKELCLDGYLLVFNNDARQDARARMPACVKSVTGHSLAHDHVIKLSQAYQAKLESNLERSGAGLSPSVVATELALEDRSEIGITRQQIATAALATVRTFQISADCSIGEQHIPESAIPLSFRLSNDRRGEVYRSVIIRQATKLWGRMRSDSDAMPIEHDTYLKIFQLREPVLPSELWLLDEYQDANPVIVGLVNSQPGQKIYIGDRYQQIYGWRGAINALEEPIRSGVDVSHLSHSWRFNHQVASAANVLLSALGETVPITADQYPLKQVNINRRHTVIARNNVGVLAAAARFILNRQPIHIAGGLPRETAIKALSALALSKDRLDQVKVPSLRSLGSWSEFKSAARVLGRENPEYEDLITLIETYGRHLPSVLELIAATEHKAKTADYMSLITITTAHKAKGREWNYVVLHDDLALPESLVGKLRGGEELSPAEREQVHLLYVAMTRAKQGLVLPGKIKANLAALHSDQHEMEALLRQRRPTLTKEQIAARTKAFIEAHVKAKVEN